MCVWVYGLSGNEEVLLAIFSVLYFCYSVFVHYIFEMVLLMLGLRDICATSVNRSQQLVSCGGANRHAEE